MEGASSLFQEALAAHQSGEFQQAEELYGKLLEQDPANLRTGFLYGTLLLQQQKFAEAVELLEPISQTKSPSPDVFNNLGLAYRGLKKWELAAGSFQNAVKADPNYPQAYFNFGELLEQAGQLSQANECYQAARELNPQDLQTASALGRVLGKQMQWEGAIEVYRSILADHPTHIESKLQLAFVLARAERLREAIEVYQNVLKTQPDFIEVYGGLGYLFERLGEFDKAEDHIHQALNLNPDFAEGWNNLGSIQLAQHQLTEAIVSFEKAVELKPELQLSLFNVATTRLMNREYELGWPGYEHRIALMPSPPQRHTELDWTGETLSGKRLLLIADQGFGDTLQFIRFVSKAKEVSEAEVILLCQPQLVTLLQSALEGIAKVVSELPPGETFDAQCLLGSLPLVLSCWEEEQLKLESPLPVPGRATTPLQELAGQLDHQALKVGIVWSGNPLQARDVLRSCPLENLVPLWKLEGIQWVNLQVDPQAVQEWNELTKTDQVNRLNAGAVIQDFADSAWLMKQLDLVLTVDTATSHLAGSLGIPTWTMLCHTPDWRWQLQRDDSPWYPQMKLFRQPNWGDWDTVVREVEESLKELLKNSSYSPN